MKWKLLESHFRFNRCVMLKLRITKTTSVSSVASLSVSRKGVNRFLRRRRDLWCWRMSNWSYFSIFPWLLEKNSTQSLLRWGEAVYSGPLLSLSQASRFVNCSRYRIIGLTTLPIFVCAQPKCDGSCTYTLAARTHIRRSLRLPLRSLRSPIHERNAATKGVTCTTAKRGTASISRSHSFNVEVGKNFPGLFQTHEFRMKNLRY